MKFRSLLGALSLAFAIIIFIPSQSLAKGSHNKGSYCKGSKGSSDKDSKGSNCKGSKGSSDKGSCDTKTETGKVCGLVFFDKNDNGKFDRKEKGAKGIKITLTDVNDDTHTIRTNKKGKYCFKNIDEGSATINIDTNTLPADAELTIGENSNEITVIPNKRNNAGRDGYSSCISTGKVCGIVFFDKNTNNKYDKKERGKKGIKVTLIDDNGVHHNKRTNKKGRYCFKNIIEGCATIVVNENTLPENSELTVGKNSNDITVIPNKKNNAGKDGYSSCTPTGSVCGLVYYDKNSNDKYDKKEKGKKGIKVTLIDDNGNTHNKRTNKKGRYCFYDIPEGSANIIVDENTLPENATLTVGKNPNNITVIPNKKNPAGKDGYSTCIPISTGSLCCTIYEDLNNNGTQDSNETGAENISISIIDINGNTFNTVTDIFGNYTVLDIPQGPATLTIDETTLPTLATLTSGLNPNKLTIIADTFNDACLNAYVIPTVTLGSVTGSVRLNRGPASNAAIEITDVNNIVHTTTTNAEGIYFLDNLPIGIATILVIDSSIPNAYYNPSLSNGNPSTILITDSTTVDVGQDSYTY